MIKKTLAISLFIILSFAITAQTFEGKIKYKAEKLMPSGNIIRIVDIFVKANKSRMEMSINDTKLSSYSLTVGAETYHVPEFENTIKKEKKRGLDKRRLKKLKKKCYILGYSCTQYKEKRNTPYGQEIVIYEVADSLKVDSLNNFGRIINGKIVLRNTLITENDTYIEEAIELKETPLPDSLFILPDYPIIEVNFEKLSKKYIKEAGY